MKTKKITGKERNIRGIGDIKVEITEEIDVPIKLRERKEIITLQCIVVPAPKEILLSYTKIKELVPSVHKIFQEWQERNDDPTEPKSEVSQEKIQENERIRDNTEDNEDILSVFIVDNKEVVQEEENDIKLKEETQKKLQEHLERAKSRGKKNVHAICEEYKMQMKKDKAVRLKPYPIPHHYQAEVLRQINEPSDQGIIPDAPSDAFVSPGFVIGKKNGKYRLVIDLREVNRMTMDIANIFPDVFTTLREIPPGNQVFSQNDLKHGYHQVPLAEDSKKYTGFVVMGKHCIYNRMPFGLKNAPAHFQKIIFGMIGQLPFVKVFLDDILIFSKNEDKHADHLGQVFKILHEKNIILNLEKSHFYKRKVEYLGNIVSAEGIQANIQRLPSLRTQKPPKNGAELMSLLGIINWYRQYIPNASIRLDKLNERLKEGKRENMRKHAKACENKQ